MQQIYNQWWPSQLYRARALEKALVKPVKIYYTYGEVLHKGSHNQHCSRAPRIH